ncbi:DUF6485 family protein [Candidatus Latescibacterota bacterium]
MKACSVESNKKNCTCSYTSCSRHGVCCECIVYHQRSGELPGCFFPSDIERTGERSISAFVRINGGR